MKKENSKKIFLLFMFLYLCFCSSTFAGNPEEQELGEPVSLINNCLRCFKPFQGSDKENQGQNRRLLLKKADSLESINFIKKNHFETLSLESLYSICYKLPPLDIIHLSRSSPHFKKVLGNEFWGNYIKVHCQKKWAENITSAKVAFAYAFFKQNKIEKAAQLGLPEAIKQVQIQKNIIKRKKEEERHSLFSIYFMVIYPQS